MTRLREAIGRPPKDHSKIFRETMENNTSIFLSRQDESEERSLLRHRSISSLLKNQARTEGASMLQSRRHSSKLRDLLKKSSDFVMKSPKYARDNKAHSVIQNYGKNGDLTKSSFLPSKEGSEI